jgi:hypothetical protein
MFKQIQKIVALVLVSFAAACGGEYEGGVTPNPTPDNGGGGTVIGSRVAFALNVSGQNGARVYVQDGVIQSPITLPDNTTRTYEACRFNWQGVKGLAFWVQNGDGSWWGCEDKSRTAQNLCFTTSTGRSVCGSQGTMFWNQGACTDGSRVNLFMPASALGVTCP